METGSWVGYLSAVTLSSVTKSKDCTTRCNQNGRTRPNYDTVVSTRSLMVFLKPTYGPLSERNKRIIHTPYMKVNTLPFFSSSCERNKEKQQDDHFSKQGMHA